MFLVILFPLPAPNDFGFHGFNLVCVFGVPKKKIFSINLGYFKMPCFSCRIAEDDVCLKAAKNDHISCLEEARSMGERWDCWTTRFAAAAGSLRCLQFAYENGCEWDEDVCTLAAKFGHLNCLEYAHSNGCSWNKWAPIYAARMGQLGCLQYLFVNNCPWNGLDIFREALLSRQLDLLK